MSDKQNNQAKVISKVKKEELKFQEQIKSFFNPESNWVKFWIFYFNIMRIIVIILVPLRFCFYQQLQTSFNDLMSLDILFTITYSINILIQLNCPYIKQNGQMCYNRYENALKYLKKQLIIDIATCIPMNNQLDILFILLTIFRLANIITLYNNKKTHKLINFIYILNGICEYLKLNKFSQHIISHLLVILIFNHYLSCFWFSLIENDYNTVFYQQLIQEDFVQQYTQCFYFTLTVLITVGYGEYQINSNDQLAYLFFFMFLNIIFYTLIISDIICMFTQYFQEQKLESDQKYDFFFQIQTLYNLNNRQTQKLQQSIFKKSNSQNVLNIFKMGTLQSFSLNLQQQISNQLCKYNIKKVVFFSNKPQYYISDLFSKCSILQYNQNDELFKFNDNSKFVYFVIQGRISQNVKINKFTFSLSYVENSNYGYEDYFLKRKRQGFCYTEENTILLVLENSIFQQSIDSYPLASVEMEQLVKIRQEYFKAIENSINNNQDLFQQSSVINNYTDNIYLINEIKDKEENNRDYLKLQLLGSLILIDEKQQRYQDNQTLKFKDIIQDKNIKKDQHQVCSDLEVKQLELNNEIDGFYDFFNEKYDLYIDLLEERMDLLDQQLECYAK